MTEYRGEKEKKKKGNLTTKKNKNKKNVKKKKRPIGNRQILRSLFIKTWIMLW
jgi:hypothetical protein